MHLTKKLLFLLVLFWSCANEQKHNSKTESVDSLSTSDTLTALEASKQPRGTEVMFRGVVVDVLLVDKSENRNNIVFFNIDAEHPDNPVAVSMYEQHSHLFKNRNFYEGKTVLVLGKIGSIEDSQHSTGKRPRIKLKKPSQLIVLD